MTMTLKSSAFDDGNTIPRQYTCQGQDISPPLSWANLPTNTRSLVLIIDDPDAPDPKAPKMTWVHWILYNLPPATPGLGEHMTRDQLPGGTREGMNDWKRCGYQGPCPPVGRHRYFHRLFALDVLLPDLGQVTRPELEKAMQAHILGQAQLMGTYQKS